MALKYRQEHDKEKWAEVRSVIEILYESVGDPLGHPMDFHVLLSLPKGRDGSCMKIGGFLEIASTSFHVCYLIPTKKGGSGNYFKTIKPAILGLSALCSD